MLCIYIIIYYIYIYLTGDKPDIFGEKNDACPICVLFLRIFTSLNISGAEPVDDSMLVRNTQSAASMSGKRNVAQGFYISDQPKACTLTWDILQIYHTFGPWVYFNDPLL